MIIKKFCLKKLNPTGSWYIIFKYKDNTVGYSCLYTYNYGYARGIFKDSSFRERLEANHEYFCWWRNLSSENPCFKLRENLATYI